ncbi:MAG: tetratricopeptide repeat protein [Proteobacteria bacterium]|nr:tetratricopeptide repeat protein [Pseudomonadota bacterium]MBU1711252.1 tetratricopeptide repeat protein [Pseudomonadota bacterium]
MPTNSHPLSSNTQYKIFAFFLVIVVGFFIYSNTYNVPFYFDDLPNITENTSIRINNLGVQEITEAIGNSPCKNRPVANLSFALNYFFHQYNLPGYHFINIIIHILTAFFFFLFLQITLNQVPMKIPSGTNIIALLATLLWLAHPVQTQTVTYVVQRMTGLAALFYILSCYCYAQARMEQNKAAGTHPKWFLAAIFSGLLSLGSKEISITLPFFIFLYEFYFFQDLKGSWLKKQIPFIAGICLLLFLLVFFFAGGNPLQSIQNSFAYRDFNLTERLLTEFRVVIFYISLLLYPNPSRLTLEHDFALSSSLLSPPTTILAIVAVLLLLIFAFMISKKNRLLGFSLLWFFGNLALESSVIGIEIIFEHRLYLPSMFFIVIFTVLLFRTIQSSKIVLSVTIFILIVSCFWTFQRNAAWSEPVRFYNDMIQKNPNKARPHFNLGLLHISTENYAEAVHEINLALVLEPRLLPAHEHLAYAYEKADQFPLAVKHLIIILDMLPDDIKANKSIGVLYGKLGNLELAQTHLARALTLSPEDPQLLVNLGTAKHRQGNLEEAFTLYNKALEIQPENAQAHNNLGLIFLSRGELPNAEDFFRKALTIDPNHAQAKQNLMHVLQQKEKISQ